MTTPSTWQVSRATFLLVPLVNKSTAADGSTLIDGLRKLRH